MSNCRFQLTLTEKNINFVPLKLNNYNLKLIYENKRLVNDVCRFNSCGDFLL